MVTRSNAEVPMFFRTKSSGPAPISRSREPLGTMVAPWAGLISYATAASGAFLVSGAPRS